jgi:threonine synthase
VIAPSDRVVCILTGHQLKDPTATVAYHSDDCELFERVLLSRGVAETPLANRPMLAPNDLDQIVRLLESRLS